MTLLQNSFVDVDKSKHLLRQFDCGKAIMNQFLVRFAQKHAKLGLSRTKVLATNDNDRQTVAAYYTLAATTLYRSDIIPSQSLPSYPIPTALIARLAVNRQFQGQRLGEKTLITALENAVQLSDNGLPMYGVALDVLDDDAMGFYRQFDFFSLTNDKEYRRLFVSIQTLRQLF